MDQNHSLATDDSLENLFFDQSLGQYYIRWTPIAKRKALMKKFAMALLFAVLAGSNFASTTLAFQNQGGNPTAFCKVINKPNPLLMGTWRCTYVRFLSGSQQYDSNPVEYRLILYGDRYALHFYRTAHGGRKQYIGWQSWTIDGDEIYSDTGVRIFVKDGTVYFNLNNGEPVNMTRVRTK
jgi:hypothetical protein